MDTQFFQQMFEKHEAIMLLIAPDTGQIIESNQAASRFYGYTTPELNSMKIHQINPLPPVQIAQTLQNALQEGHTQIIVPHQLASGEIRTVEIHSSSITWRDKTVLFAIIHDITERSQAEEALRRSEQKCRAIIESVSEGIILVDLKGCIIFANPTATQMFAYSPEELVGQGIELLLPESYREIHVKHCRNYMAAPKIRRMGEQLDLMAQRKDGSVFPVEIGLSFAELDTGMVVICFIEDITERKQAAEALAESERKLKTLFESLPIGISVLNKDNKISYMNPALGQILRIPLTDLLQGNYQQRTYLHPDGTPMLNSEFASRRAIHEQQTVYNVETGIVTEKNETIWVNVTAVPVNFSDWQVIIISDDITERKRLEKALQARQEEHLLQELFEAMPIPIFYKDLQGHYLACNQAFTTVVEKSKAEIIGQSAFAIFPEAIARKQQALDLALIAKPHIHQVYEYSLYQQKLQEEHTFLVTKSVIKNVQHQVMGLVGGMIDITKQKRMEVVLQKRLDFFQLMFEHHNAIMLLLDPISGQIIESNQAARQFYGYPIAQMNSMNIQNINMLPSPEVMEIQRAAIQGERNYFIVPHRLASGKIRTVEAYSSPIIWQDNKMLFVIIHDITERKQIEQELQVAKEKLEEMAIRDFLTGVYNRVLLMEKLNQALAQRENNMVAVFTIDLDKFKKINDTYGHQEGDHLLIEVANRMKQLLREVDTLIRLGGDEFLLIAPNIELYTQAENIAARLLEIGRRLIELGGMFISPTFSIGIALCPQDGTTAEMLLANSDRALYMAKSLGKNCYVFAHNSPTHLSVGRAQRRLGTI